MTARVVLNIGWARAASTAFRRNFLERRPDILAVGRDQPPSDGPAAAILRSLKADGDAEFEAAAPGLAAAWHNYVESSPRRILCLTDEELSIGLYGAGPDPVTIAARCGVLFPGALTLAIVRDQVEAIRSFYTLAELEGATQGLSLSDWTRRLFLAPEGRGFAYLFDYWTTLSAYLAWQPRDAVAVLAYEGLGRDPAAFYVAAARAIGASEEGCADLANARLNTSSEALGRPRGRGARPEFEPGVEDEIRALFEPGNRELAATFGIEFAKSASAAPRRGRAPERLSDFGGFPAATPSGVHAVGDLETLRRVMDDCRRRGRRMRSRCFAHSMNGMAVPAPGETLLDLSGVRHVAWLGEDVISAGAGLSVWELDRHVRRFGWKLPVVNDGGAAAPSIGGFIAAGGIGESSVFYGGFWESVRAVRMATATGEVVRLDRDDPAFPWLFGAMGALGVVHEAEIELVQAGADLGVPVEDRARLEDAPASTWPEHLWLTLFVSETRLEEAAAELMALVDAHPRAWTAKAPYEYYLSHRRFSPPLLFPEETDFIALGVWGDRPGKDAGLSAYLALEADFQRRVEDRGLRRYFQSELIRTPRPLDRYLGRETAARFGEIKAAFDPEGLLNPFMPERG